MIERFIVLFVAVMQVLDVYTYIFEIVKIYFGKNSKILVLINFSQRGWTSYMALGTVHYLYSRGGEILISYTKIL